MNVEEGARRIFVVLQWIAAAFVIAVGVQRWPEPPNYFAPFDKLTQNQASPPYVTDPVILAQLNAGSPKEEIKPWEKPWANDPVIAMPADRSTAYAIDVAGHVALFSFGAILAYFAVFACWKLLRWVFSGFALSRQ